VFPKPEQKNPLPAKPVAKTQPAERVTLVPYDCTKLRVSMFPITERVEKLSDQGPK